MVLFFSGLGITTRCANQAHTTWVMAVCTAWVYLITVHYYGLINWTYPSARAMPNRHAPVLDRHKLLHSLFPWAINWEKLSSGWNVSAGFLLESDGWNIRPCMAWTNIDKCLIDSILHSCVLLIHRYTFLFLLFPSIQEMLFQSTLFIMSVVLIWRTLWESMYVTIFRHLCVQINRSLYKWRCPLENID